jgi:cytochrome d ubiquinol oxidase subunit I
MNHACLNPRISRQKLVYGVVFSFGIYYINRLIANGPQGTAVEPPQQQFGSPFAGAVTAGREAPSRG